MTLGATVAAAGIVQLPTAAIVVAIPTIHAERTSPAPAPAHPRPAPRRTNAA